MFVLTVKFRVMRGKEAEIVRLLCGVMAQVRQNEPDTLMYDLHRKIGEPTELLLYERYPDRRAWETHISASYIKELQAAMSDCLESGAEVTEYETVEIK